MSEEVTDMSAPKENGADETTADVAPERSLPTDPLLRAVVEPVASATFETVRTDDIVTVAAGDLAAIAQAAKDAGFEMCVDVTAVDYKDQRRVRFEVVVGLLSHQHNRRLRVLVPLDEASLSVPSLVPVYPGTNFFEREVYDMFGIEFEGHPDLTRILMPDDWVGYPLRKDFGVGAVPVQFKEAPQAN